MVTVTGLRTVQRDMPTLVDGVREAAPRDAERAVGAVGAVEARQSRVEASVTRLSEENPR